MWVLGVILCILPMYTAAVDTTGSCGQNLTWSLDADGTLTVMGTGEMTEFTYTSTKKTDVPWIDSIQNIKKVVVGSGVTTIGSHAFVGAENLTEVLLPDSLTTIGYGAFGDCTSLTSVTIPASVNSIGDAAFVRCNSMQKMIFLGDAPSLGVVDSLPDVSGFQVVYDPTTSGWDDSAWDKYTLVQASSGDPDGNIADYTVTMTASAVTLCEGETIYFQIEPDHAFAAADLQLQFDPDFFVYAQDSAELPTGSVVLHSAQTVVQDGVLHLADFGNEKSFYKIPFQAIKSGNTTFTLLSAKFSEAKDAADKDLTEAAIETDTIEITVTPPRQSVTLPNYFKGSDTVAYGEDYIFEVIGENVYYNYEITAKMDKERVEVEQVDDTTYKISNVTGSLVIEAERSPKQFTIFFQWEDQTEAIPQDTMTYGTPYTFELPTITDHSVSVYSIVYYGTTTTVDSTAQGSTITIPGTSITGKILVTFTSVRTNATVTVSGDVGDVTYFPSATPGSDYTFTINKDEKYSYSVTAKVNGRTVKVQESENGYTISADNVEVGTIEITVTKTLKLDNVEVISYLELSSTRVWRIFVSCEKMADRTYVYNGNYMFWSAKYEGYCTLVIAAEAPTVTVDDLTLQAGTGAEVDYNMDVNNSGTVDANDAQMAYNIYNCVYSSFTENVTIEKFLRADVNGDGTVSVLDSTAIIHGILHKTN